MAIKVTQISKDFNMKSKDLINIITEITGNEKLKTGFNVINIKVTETNETTSEYKIIAYKSPTSSTQIQDLNNLNISLKHSFIRILLPIIHFNSSAFIPMESFESGGLEKERF